MSSLVFQIILIVSAGWIALSILILPVAMLIGRAGYHADLDAQHQHHEMLDAEVPLAAPSALPQSPAFHA